MGISFTLNVLEDLFPKRKLISGPRDSTAAWARYWRSHTQIKIKRDFLENEICIITVPGRNSKLSEYHSSR
jgi:hypothetical protein